MSNATKKGFHKGCFGGATSQVRTRNRQKIAELQFSAYRYARDAVRMQMEVDTKMQKTMENPRIRTAAIDRIAAKRMKELRREGVL